MAKKIKPCPFCGSKAEYSDEMGAIMCEGCGFYFECPTTLEQSLETWNRRDGVVPPVPPKEKDVVVRAWAWLSLNGDIGAATVNACGSKVPCTITVKAEDMRKARK